MQALQRLGARLHDDMSIVIGRISDRLTSELPVAGDLSQAQLEDHLVTLLSDIFLVVTSQDDDRTREQHALDSAEIQRLIAELHGRQRRRLGWSAEDLDREYAILSEELQSFVQHRAVDEKEARAVADLVGQSVEQSREGGRKGYRVSAAETNAAADRSPSPAASGGEGRMAREFVDSVGVAWTVREITPGPMPPKLLAMLRTERRRGGWLLFISADGDRRRLSPVPEGWAEMSRFEIERWCMRARRVPPAPERRAEDRAP